MTPVQGGRFPRAARALALAAAAILLLVPVAAGRPTCHTPPSSDRGSVPCNPHLANSPYPTAHTNNFAQASTAIPGPVDAGDVTVQTIPFTFIPLGAIYSPPYPDRRLAVWGPVITAQQDSRLWKVDEQTGTVIDTYSRDADEGTAPEQEPAISRVYGGLDRFNRLYRAAGAAIEIMGDAQRGVRTSAIRLIKRWPLPSRAMCRPDDLVVGLTILYDGRLAFVTNQGVVGVLPRHPRRMTDANLILHSINGADCADESVTDRQLETTTNSIVSDPRGGIYPLTDEAQYKFAVRNGRLRQVWRTAYKTGSAGGSGVRIDQGSGSTPTLMGTRRDDDKFVVITDGQALMHLVLIWRDRIPKDWKGLPGRPRRIACEYPIDFGDPTRKQSSSEQSVVVRRYASFLPNNELNNAEQVDALLQAAGNNQQARQAVAGLLGQDPEFAPYGFERIDWLPRKRRCATRWVNARVSIPNGVPYMSIGSRMVYGIGQRDGVNGLEGMDMATGRSRLWVPAGSSSQNNAFFSALNVGPDGSMWTGGFNGMTKYVLAAD